MKRKRSLYLSQIVTKQYPIEELKTLIFAVLDIVENYLICLGYDNVLDLRSHRKYGEMIGGYKRNFSTDRSISLIIKIDDTKEKMEKFLSKYYSALNSLEVLEREMFIYTFIDILDNLSIMEKMHINSTTLTTIRKSMIIRFSLKLGLEKLVSKK